MSSPTLQSRRPLAHGLRGVTLLFRGGLAIIVGYLGVLSVAATRAARRSTPPTRSDAPTHRFVVLVPAHDEERLIGSTLESLADLDYPGELVAVHVVADNCSDRTAEIVRTAGFEVHERDDPDHAGKGPALQWLMARLWNRGDQHDAIVFVDADTTVSSEFLLVVDTVLATGATVVQGHYAVRDEGESPVVAFRAAALAARTYLRPLGRAAIGGSAGLYGNGMVFRTDVMRKQSWSDHLTEDIELHLDLLLEGTLVAFAPGAVVAAEMPATLEASRTQHERWERGRLDMARRYVPSLLRRTVTGGPAGRVAYADAALDQAVPPFSVVVAGTVLWGAAAGIGALLFGGSRRWRDVGAAATVLAAEGAYVMTALRLVGAPPAVYRSLWNAPRMIVWKLGLWFGVLRRPADATWTRTARN